MPLGTEEGLGPGHIVLDGDPAPPANGHSPQFLAHVCCGQTAGWIKMLTYLVGEVDLDPGVIVLDEDPAPPNKGHSPPPNFFPCLLWPKGLMNQDAIWYGGRPRLRPHCVRWGPISP